ncbi:MAG: anti-sigma factor domain-containing protein [Clostridiaceae bacterium]
MNKTGLVVKVDRKIAILMTSTGEFEKVKMIGTTNIGELYTGKTVKDRNYSRYLVAAILMLFIMVSGGGAYAYYTPVATLEVSINPSIEIKLNRFSRIIKIKALNDDGEILVKNLDINNNNVDEGLTKVLEKAEKDNFIDEDYIEGGNTIKVQVKSEKSLKINVEKFKEFVDKKNIDTEITVNGERQLKINKNKDTKEIEEKDTEESENSSGNKANEDKSAESTDDTLKDTKDNKSNDSQEDANNSIPSQNEVKGNNPDISKNNEKDENTQMQNSNANNEDISKDNGAENKHQNTINEGAQKKSK